MKTSLIGKLGVSAVLSLVMASGAVASPTAAKTAARAKAGSEEFQENMRQVNPEDLKSLNQKELTALYRRIAAPTAIPQGAFVGTVILPSKKFALQFDKVVFGQVESGMQAIWGGKVFGEELRNLIKKKVAESLGNLLKKPGTGEKIDWDRIPQQTVNGVDYRLMFPATLSNGVSQDDGAPSVIIDYVAGKSTANYQDVIDYLASDVLKIRDEIREVRPGFYLGQAWVDVTVAGKSVYKGFALNFTLEQADSAK